MLTGLNGALKVLTRLNGTLKVLTGLNGTLKVLTGLNGSLKVLTGLNGTQNLAQWQLFGITSVTRVRLWDTHEPVVGLLL